MKRKPTSRLYKATAVMPIAVLSAAWTANLAGFGPAVLTAAPAPTTSQPAAPSTSTTTAGGVPVVPGTAPDAPATVSAPAASASGRFTGNVQAIAADSPATDIPAAALSAYQRAETVIGSADPSCHLTWQLIAAIGRVESDHGRFGGSTLNAQGVETPSVYGPALNGRNGTTRILDTDGGAYDADPVFDRAVGPMQFIPSTWAVAGVDADDDGVRNPQDIDDASLATAVYLCSGDGDLSTRAGQEKAVYSYNHSRSYVSLVLSIAAKYLNGQYLAAPGGTLAAGYLTPAGTTTVTDTSTTSDGTGSTDAPGSGSGSGSSVVGPVEQGTPAVTVVQPWVPGTPAPAPTVGTGTVSNPVTPVTPVTPVPSGPDVPATPDPTTPVPDPTTVPTDSPTAPATSTDPTSDPTTTGPGAPSDPDPTSGPTDGPTSGPTSGPTGGSTPASDETCLQPDPTDPASGIAADGTSVLLDPSDPTAPVLCDPLPGEPAPTSTDTPATPAAKNPSDD